MTALQLEQVGFAYGARQALDDVSFQTSSGRFTALLGPNGAGKSTLIALLTRLYDLQQGEIRVAGFSLRQQLGERRRHKVRELNGGHRRRVEIARALLHKPSLLLLDEASAGLDPASRQGLNQHVRQLCRDEGMSVLWTTHLLDEVQGDDDLLVLNRGRLVASGTAASLSQDGEDLAASFARLTQVPA